MDLENITIKFVKQSPWQALDQGVEFIKKNFSQVLFPWLTLMIPLFLVTLVPLDINHIILILLIWWLKPLYDRVLLLIISRCLFAEDTRLKTLLSLPKTWLISISLIKDLTINRFSLMRSYTLPVKQLELLKSEACKQRIKLLSQAYGKPAKSLTILALHMEFVVNAGLMAALFLMIPQGFNLDYLINNEPGSLYNIIVIQVYIVTIAIIEPFYVASGFLLYINKRIDLEAWDIEIVFRTLAKKNA